MRIPQKLPFIFLAVFIFSVTACNKFTVKDVNYAQQIESVLTPDENGLIEDVRHGISFNVKPFQNQEFGELDSIVIEEIRLIRNKEGFYFITANEFKHVYVMEPGKGELTLKNKIPVSDEGLNTPVFNLRDNRVQLVQLSTNDVYLLDENGIKNNKEKSEEQS